MAKSILEQLDEAYKHLDVIDADYYGRHPKDRDEQLSLMLGDAAHAVEMLESKLNLRDLIDVAKAAESVREEYHSKFGKPSLYTISLLGEALAKLRGRDEKI